LCLLLALTGCRQQKPPPAPPEEIARVGDASINRDAFQALLNMRAHGPSNRFATLSAKEALLDELIRREAVFARAKAAGFDQRPDMKESIKRLIAAKFQDEQMRQWGTDKPSVSEQEIQQYYQQHTEKYATAATVRGAILLLKISPLAEAGKREQLMAKAQSLLAQARAAAPPDFARLVEANSEDQATRYRAGDIGWVSRETRAWELEPAVIEALFALQKPGDFAPLVPTKKGVYIVKLLDAHPAGMRPLAEVKEAIAYTLGKQKQEQREQEFFAAMKAGLDIRINRPLLETIRPAPAPDQTPPTAPGAVAQEK
jgi:parvulin-like peptidyl-prolyl isomerase